MADCVLCVQRAKSADGAAYVNIENDALEAYVTRFAKGPEDHCYGSLEHANPYVCAYALRTLWRARVTRGEPLRLSELPSSLLERPEVLEQQWACHVSETTLGDYARSRISESS